MVMGVGLLSLPYALKSAGWIGLVLLMLMGYIAAYTGAHTAASRWGFQGVGGRGGGDLELYYIPTIETWIDVCLLEGAHHGTLRSCFERVPSMRRRVINYYPTLTILWSLHAKG